ncbi:uncharacterized protein LOC116343619 [Contarinia nasturtii]|uniref:uncharacterized protein LOC116343619 n=1 Tax=Contarinia nasturtii TaxID=265458 RepID=UPI0012D3ACCE|nr:uncharacterized protein LOC116343619 [Contarinia nasturtii]XP_031627663.1 uncharacterized protein LOC116343619 [Contarinia nasturtii]
MHTNKSSTNYLLNAIHNEESSQNLLRIAFCLARTGKKVTFISRKSPESLPIEDGADETLYRDILMNIVFSYSFDATELIKYLLGIEKLQPRPDVVIIDFLHTFFEDHLISSWDTDHNFQSHFIECHMLITASLFSTMDVLSNGSRDKFISVICIDPNRHKIYKRFIQTLVDSYYYKPDCILSMKDSLERFAKLN